MYDDRMEESLNRTSPLWHTFHQDSSEKYSTPPRQPQHSTPTKQSQLSRSAPSHGRQKTRSSSKLQGVKKNLSAEMETSTLSSLATSPASKARVSEFENKTIQKQRRELELLIAELRDRDKELNDMVEAHQKQIVAWERDRQKILNLEEKCTQLERDYRVKSDHVRQLTSRIRIVESEDLNKSTALESTQGQLAKIADQHSQTSLRAQDLEEKTRNLTTSLQEMSSNMRQVEAREQELLSVLAMKDRDLSESSTRSAELSAKLKMLETRDQEARVTESELRRKVTEWKNKYTESRKEVDRLRKDSVRREQLADEQHLETQRLKQELTAMKREVMIANEREKRKDQLLELQKSKQDRTDSELVNLRQLYERQMRDLSLLHLNLESTKELLASYQNAYSSDRSFSAPKSSPARVQKLIPSYRSPLATRTFHTDPLERRSYLDTELRGQSAYRTDITPEDDYLVSHIDILYKPPQGSEIGIADTQHLNGSFSSDPERFTVTSDGSTDRMSQHSGSAREMQAPLDGSTDRLSHHSGSVREMPAPLDSSTDRLSHHSGSVREMPAPLDGSTDRLSHHSGSVREMPAPLDGSTDRLSQHSGSVREMRAPLDGSTDRLSHHSGSVREMPAPLDSSTDRLSHHSGSVREMPAPLDGSTDRLSHHSGSVREMPAPLDGSTDRLSHHSGSLREMPASGGSHQSSRTASVFSQMSRNGEHSENNSQRDDVVSSHSEILETMGDNRTTSVDGLPRSHEDLSRDFDGSMEHVTTEAGHEVSHSVHSQDSYLSSGHVGRTKSNSGPPSNSSWYSSHHDVDPLFTMTGVDAGLPTAANQEQMTEESRHQTERSVLNKEEPELTNNGDQLQYSSLRELDSPSTKLERVLTESRELVKDLEKSVNSSGSDVDQLDNDKSQEHVDHKELDNRDQEKDICDQRSDEN